MVPRLDPKSSECETLTVVEGRGTGHRRTRREHNCSTALVSQGQARSASQLFPTCKHDFHLVGFLDHCQNLKLSKRRAPPKVYIIINHLMRYNSQATSPLSTVSLSNRQSTLSTRETKRVKSEASRFIFCLFIRHGEYQIPLAAAQRQFAGAASWHLPGT